MPLTCPRQRGRARRQGSLCPRVPLAPLAGPGHWHVAGIIPAQPWPAGSFPGLAQSEPPFSALFIHRHGATGAGHGQGLGVQPHHDTDGLMPSTGAAGAGTDGDVNCLAQAQAPACSTATTNLAQPTGTTRSRSGQRGCWLQGAGACRWVSPTTLCSVLGAAGTDQHVSTPVPRGAEAAGGTWGCWVQWEHNGSAEVALVSTGALLGSY